LLETVWELYIHFSFIIFRLFGRMECISRQDQSQRRAKSSLTFSIDKIIGTNNECTDDTARTSSESNSKDFASRIVKDPEPDTSGGVSFQPVKSRQTTMHLDMIQQQDQYQHAATLLKAEMQKRQLSSYYTRELYDVNMNAVPFLHPAFMLGRMCPDEYKAQIFQNLSALHQQWPNFHKEALYSLDMLRPSDVKTYSVHPSHSEEQIQSITKLKSMVECKDRKNVITKERVDEKEREDDKSKPVIEKSKQELSPVEVDTPVSSGRKVVPKSQKSFSCPECGKLFNAHYNLTRHMPVHTGTYN